MKTNILQSKLERYINGQATPSETRQIQTWLSCTAEENRLSPEEKSALEMEILHEVQAYTEYPLFFPKKEKTAWWQKITALF
jgi:hypothetical protein